MAKKENKTKKKTQNKSTDEAPALPNELTQEDKLILQIVVKDFENANLQLQLHQLKTQQLQTQAEKAQQKVREINGQINEKYGLSSERGDRVDITTGTITRGV